jgi:hypothetical protein
METKILSRHLMFLPKPFHHCDLGGSYQHTQEVTAEYFLKYQNNLFFSFWDKLYIIYDHCTLRAAAVRNEYYSKKKPLQVVFLFVTTSVHLL